MSDSPQSPPPSPPSIREPAKEESAVEGDATFRACPVCGGALIDIRHKLVCARCHTICETCCEGGRG